MQNINHVVISGHLTRDPELRNTQSGTPVLVFGIAVNGSRRNPQTDQWEDVPNFFDVTVWGNRANGLSGILGKGMKVTVQGKLRWTQWQDKQSGQNRSKVDITADLVELPPRSTNDRQIASQTPSQHASQPQYVTQTPAVPVNQTVYDHDIPF